jgi:hypothetical protein
MDFTAAASSERFEDFVLTSSILWVTPATLQLRTNNINEELEGVSFVLNSL